MLAPACLLIGSLSLTTTSANDTRHLWRVGSSLGFHTTEDEIRNNANLQGDPRPSQDEVDAGGIDDGLNLAGQIGFSLTGRFALQLEVGWFRGDIGPVDVYLSERYPAPGDPRNPTVLTRTTTHTASYPTTAGRLTEIPVSLSLETRFRKDKPLSPFLTVGFGYIFTKVERDAKLDLLNERIASLRVREIFDESGNALTAGNLVALKAQGLLPPSHLVRLEAEDAPEWHLGAGLEYFIGGRSSLVFSTAYTFSSGGVRLLLAGEDQVTYWTYPERLFRKDGSLKIFNDFGMFPNPYIDPQDPSLGTVRCTVNTVGDFDHDGRAGDLCYRNDDRTKLDDPEGRLLIQAGEISYDGFRVSLGMRFYF
jgi:hypothetical protein